jgi:DNA-3-methyladenine glycosylase
MSRLDPTFFHRDCLEVAPDLVGKIICHRLPDGSLRRLRISETEAYRGEEDTACHAHKGKTARTAVLYGPPGVLYIYLCYGMHNLLNVVTGRDGIPQGVLIRACVTADGPGKLTKALGLDRTLHGTALAACADVFWFEDDDLHPALTTKPRVGIGYASPEDQARLWRFCGKNLPPL